MIGWWTFWFLCDDAYIEFRYVSNSVAGHGYVWNAPPFKPVEGYTSFLWIALLDAVWRLTGVPADGSANAISLLCNLGAMGLTGHLAWRLPLSERLARHRLGVLIGVMGLTLTNRAYLVWTSSGLETSMVTVLVIGWLHAALLSDGKATWALSCWAATLALTRPDGYLYMAATLAIIGLYTLVSRDVRRLATLLPLGAVAAHVLWRHGFYGYCLPNTYYAKHVAPWPEMGALYLASFVYEFAYWVWLGMLGVLAVRWGRARGWETLPRGLPDGEASLARWTRVVGILTVLAHFGYYTFNVGGDHFEYRVYHHLVPLIALAFFPTADALGWTWEEARRWAIAMLVLGLILPWTLWYQARGAVTKSDPGSFVFPIAGFLSPPLSWYAMPFDLMQEGMLRSFVGIRQQGHKTYLYSQQQRFPSREIGEQVSAEGFPVLVQAAVGWPAWSMPNVYIIDKLGLNDIVIARNPKLRSMNSRLMAHDRKPPPGYLACFRANVKPSRTAVKVEPRKPPMTAEDIVQCEEKFLEIVTRGP